MLWRIRLEGGDIDKYRDDIYYEYLGERNILHHLNLKHVHPVHIALYLEVEPQTAGLESLCRGGVIVVVRRWREVRGPELAHSDQVVTEVSGHVHLHVVDSSPLCPLLSAEGKVSATPTSKGPLTDLGFCPLHLANTGGPVTRPIREIAPILTSNLVNLI